MLPPRVVRGLLFCDAVYRLTVIWTGGSSTLGGGFSGWYGATTRVIGDARVSRSSVYTSRCLFGSRCGILPSNITTPQQSEWKPPDQEQDIGMCSLIASCVTVTSLRRRLRCYHQHCIMCRRCLCVFRRYFYFITAGVVLNSIGPCVCLFVCLSVCQHKHWKRILNRHWGNSLWICAVMNSRSD